LYNYMKHIGNMPVSFSNQIIWKFWKINYECNGDYTNHRSSWG
jgi:hypothetical protein